MQSGALHRAIPALGVIGLLTVGCSGPKPPTTGAPTLAERQGRSRPSADQIQTRIRQVQADPNMPAEQKQFLISEMQHAVGDGRTPGAPPSNR